MQYKQLKDAKFSMNGLYFAMISL